MASMKCRPTCVGRLTHAISDSAAAALTCHHTYRRPKRVDTQRSYLDVPGSQLFRVICHAASSVRPHTTPRPGLGLVVAGALSASERHIV